MNVESIGPHEHSLTFCIIYHFDLTPALKRQRQGDFCEFEVSLLYIMSSKVTELQSETLSQTEQKSPGGCEVPVCTFSSYIYSSRFLGLTLGDLGGCLLAQYQCGYCCVWF